MKALVTRPREDAATLASALAARGWEPLIEPMLAIRYAAAAAETLPPLLDGAQAVLFTSANGVRAFAAATKRRDLPAFAVGDATAGAARASGFAAVESAGGTVEDLARLVAARMRPGNGALLHAAGSAVAGDLSGRLGAAGFAIRRTVLYDAVPATKLSPACAAAIADGSVGIALFFSPRTAASFVRLAAAAGLADKCLVIVAVALSPPVAAALGTFSWRALFSADAPNEASLLATLDRALAGGAAGSIFGTGQDASA